MSLYYRRDGTPYPGGIEGLTQWMEDIQNKVSHIVKQTMLPNGKFVSTIWLGLDHGFLNDGPPLIFETMVFQSPEDLNDLACKRYPTESEAIKGHEDLCRVYSVIPDPKT